MDNAKNNKVAFIQPEVFEPSKDQKYWNILFKYLKQQGIWKEKIYSLTASLLR
jgi:hypothetical protein